MVKYANHLVKKTYIIIRVTGWFGKKEIDIVDYFKADIEDYVKMYIQESKVYKLMITDPYVL